MRGPAQHPRFRGARTEKRRRGVRVLVACWSSKVGAALGTRARWGRAGNKGRRVAGGGGTLAWEEKGGTITEALSLRGQGQRAGSPPLVGVGGMNPNFLKPEGTLLGLGGAPGLHLRMVRTSTDWGSGVFVGVLFPRAGQTAGRTAELSGEAFRLLGVEEEHSPVGAAISPHLQTWHLG